MLVTREGVHQIAGPQGSRAAGGRTELPLLQVEFDSITRPGRDPTAKEVLILGPNRKAEEQCYRRNVRRDRIVGCPGKSGKVAVADDRR